MTDGCVMTTHKSISDWTDAIIYFDRGALLFAFFETNLIQLMFCRLVTNLCR